MIDPQRLRVRVGKALRRLRKESGLTAAQVARRMGKRASWVRQISRWELGQNAPGADQLYALLLALDKSFADLDRALDPSAANPRLEKIARRLVSLAAPETMPPAQRSNHRR